MKKFELIPISQRRAAGSTGRARGLIGNTVGGPGSSVDDRITRLVAIKLIGERDRRPGDDLRTSDGRATKLIDYAINNGTLEFGTDRKVALGDFVAWTRTKAQLREKFAGLPVRPKPVELESTATASSWMTADLSPGTLEACQKALGEAQVLLREQTTEMTALQREVDRLRPLAVKYENIKAKNKISAGNKRNRLA